MKLFMCYGTIRYMKVDRPLLILNIDVRDISAPSKKPPVRIEVHGAMARYLYERHIGETNDVFENYMNAKFFYDEDLILQYIVFKRNGVIVKIVANTYDELGEPADELKFFGQPDYITNTHPTPITDEEAKRWIVYKAKHYG